MMPSLKFLRVQRGLAKPDTTNPSKGIIFIFFVCVQVRFVDKEIVYKGYFFYF